MSKKNGEKEVASFKVKAGLAQMLKGGVIMDVVTAEHAKIAEDAGAVELPAPVQALMHGMSRIMTNGAKWV